jgi:hypothetical protein
MTSSIFRSRIRREKQTLGHMFRLYCRAHHGSHQQLCPPCHSLLERTCLHLHHCPFGNDKPVCGRCPNNCHASPDHAIPRNIMRYAGPRLLWHHPLLALFHILDSKKHLQQKMR